MERQKVSKGKTRELLYPSVKNQSAKSARQIIPRNVKSGIWQHKEIYSQTRRKFSNTVSTVPLSIHAQHCAEQAVLQRGNSYQELQGPKGERTTTQLTACHNLHCADARNASSYRARRTTVAEAGNFQSKVQMRPEETPKRDGWGVPRRWEICRPQVLFLCKGPPTCSFSQVPAATCRTRPDHACWCHAWNIVVTSGMPSPLVSPAVAD